MPEEQHGVEYPPPPLWEVLDRMVTKPSDFGLADMAHWAGLARDALMPPKVGNGVAQCPGQLTTDDIE